jgi:hypothetical protein
MEETEAMSEIVREQFVSGPLPDRALIFHSWADCPGMIVSEQVGPDALALKCAECGAIVGRVEPGLLDELLALVPGAGAVNS